MSTNEGLSPVVRESFEILFSGQQNTVDFSGLGSSVGAILYTLVLPNLACRVVMSSRGVCWPL